MSCAAWTSYEHPSPILDVSLLHTDKAYHDRNCGGLRGHKPSEVSDNPWYVIGFEKLCFPVSVIWPTNSRLTDKTDSHRFYWLVSTFSHVSCSHGLTTPHVNTHTMLLLLCHKGYPYSHWVPAKQLFPEGDVVVMPQCTSTRASTQNLTYEGDEQGNHQSQQQCSELYPENVFIIFYICTQWYKDNIFLMTVDKKEKS